MADEEAKEFDTNDALTMSETLWLEFANRCRERSEEILADNASALDLSVALKFAKHAEAAYWQATGDVEPFSFDTSEFS